MHIKYTTLWLIARKKAPRVGKCKCNGSAITVAGENESQSKDNVDDLD